ncbi:unnamed protein product [Discosporangium mesarthrocarpum]
MDPAPHLCRLGSAWSPEGQAMHILLWAEGRMGVDGGSVVEWWSCASATPHLLAGSPYQCPRCDLGKIRQLDADGGFVIEKRREGKAGATIQVQVLHELLTVRR